MLLAEKISESPQNISPNLITTTLIAILVAIISPLITGLVTSYWERKKINRDYLVKSYSDFLTLSSLHWKLLKERSIISKGKNASWIKGKKPNRGALELENNSEWNKLNTQIRNVKQDLYSAYSTIQIVGDVTTVQEALSLIQLHDRQNNKYFGFPTSGVGDPDRKKQIGKFVSAARRDLGLKNFYPNLSD